MEARTRLNFRELTSRRKDDLRRPGGGGVLGEVAPASAMLDGRLTVGRGGVLLLPPLPLALRRGLRIAVMSRLFRLALPELPLLVFPGETGRLGGEATPSVARRRTVSPSSSASRTTLCFIS